jgi:hypothetical protein
MHKFIKESRKYLDGFIEHCCQNNRIPYIKKGVLNIEAFYWWSLVGYFKPDIILESGVAYGRSTEVLARAQEFFKIPYHYAFDIDSKHYELVSKKLKPYKTIYQIKGSVEGFDEVRHNNPIAKIVSIIDGPKSGGAFAKVLKTLSKFPNLCGFGCHDCMPTSRIPPVLRSYCETLFPERQLIFTNQEMNKDVQFVNDYIKGEMGEKQDELLDRSNYVGLCL